MLSEACRAAVNEIIVMVNAITKISIAPAIFKASDAFSIYISPNFMDFIKIILLTTMD
jgi:hypothetical protein